MRMDDNTYSRVVNWLKVILPMLALGLLSTLFLVARTVDPAQQLPFADVDVDELAREQRIGAPNFTGVTSTGAAIAVSAETAAPDPENDNRMTGETVIAEIDLPSGERITIRAGAMELNYEQGIARLMRSVEISASSGYTLHANLLEVGLNAVSVRSAEPITLTSALGELSAGSFELTETSQTGDTHVLVFNGGIKLLYRPES